jgi:hypothetical protein
VRNANVDVWWGWDEVEINCERNFKFETRNLIFEALPLK